MPPWCLQGDAEACYQRLLMVAYGRGTLQDYVEAARGFKDLWDTKRHGAAAFFLGTMHTHGQGVPVDYELARYYLQEAADSKDPRVHHQALAAFHTLDASVTRAQAVNNETLRRVEAALHESDRRRRQREAALTGGVEEGHGPDDDDAEL